MKTTKLLAMTAGFLIIADNLPSTDTVDIMAGHDFEIRESLTTPFNARGVREVT